MTVRQLFVALFVITLFTLPVRETLDPDLWWHLRTGQVIWEEGIPRHDLFSFTVPQHEWVTHEWLSQLFMWLVYLPAGLGGLMLVFAAIIAVTFWLVYVRCDGRPYLAVFVVLLAALASAPAWGARPQMFNLLFLAAFVNLVESFRDQKMGRRALLLLPILTAIWANLHSGYLLGVVLLATYTVGQGLQLLLHQRQDRALTRPDVRWLGLVAGASFLAALINPNGYRLWIYPFQTLGSQAMQQYIQEWHSPDFHLPYFWPFAALMGLGVISWLWSRQRPAWTDVLLFAGTAAAGLLSARHIPLFAVVAAPIVARYLASSLAETPAAALWNAGRPQGKPVLLLSTLNGALLLLALLAAGLWANSKVMANDDAVAARYPVAAVDFLEESGLAASRGYNSYNWGGYLIWRGLPVFVDGRADVYGDEFLHYYRRTYDLTSNWQQPLDEFDVAYVLVERATPLTTLLATSDQWQEVYQDNVAQIFVRAAGGRATQ